MLKCKNLLAPLREDGLKLLLLGKPQIEQGGASLKLPRKKALALLSYFAMTGRAHSRETLAGLFWPDNYTEKAHASLRNAIWVLKQTLGEEWILAERDTIGLRPETQLWLDAAHFQRLLETPTSHHPHPNPDICVDCFGKLQEAIDLYQGDFMAGFYLPDNSQFYEWQLTESERLRDGLEAVLQQVVSYLSGHGQFEAAIHYGRRWVTHNPLNEKAHQSLIQAYAGSGKRALAIRQYQDCLRILREELDVSPSQDLIALYERLRTEGIHSHRTQGQKYPTTPSTLLSARPAKSPSQLLELPFVGRSDEFRRMVAIHHESCTGVPQVVCLSGEAGIGKTRLVNAFQNWIALEGSNPESGSADVISGAAYEAGGRLSYQAIVDALRARIDRENAPDDLLPDIWLAELSQLLPELRERYPDLPLPMTGEPSFMRSRLFEAVASLGIALAAKRPVVITIDDLQWADEGTLDMLQYLCRRWAKEKTPILFVLAAREEALSPGSGLQIWLAQLGRDIPLSYLKLECLNSFEVEQLAKSVLVGLSGQPHPDLLVRFRDWLLRETDGLPFFIAEIFKMLQEQDIRFNPDTNAIPMIDATVILKKIETGERIPVPDSVYSLVRTRLAHLTETARALLVASAVLGRETSFARLCHIANLDETLSLPAIEDLLNRRLLHKLEGHLSYAFTHDKIREVVYQEAGEERRTLYHLRVFRVLEQEQAPSAELAFHALAAGLDEPAFRYSLAAGDEAMNAYATANALIHYNHALDTARHIEVDSDSLRRLCMARGRALELASRYLEADENYRELAAMARQRNDPSLELACLVAQTILYATQTPLNNSLRAREMSERSLVLAKALNDERAEARVLWALLLVEAWGNGDNRKALEYGQRSLEISRRLGLIEQMGYTLTNLVNVFWNLDETEAAREANLQARKIWEEIGNMPMLADSYTMSLICYQIAGEYDLALQAFKEGYQISQAIGNRWNEIVATAMEGGIKLQMGIFGEAVGLIQEAVLRADTAGLFPWLSYVLVNAYINIGDLDKAEQIADELIPIVENIVPLYRPIVLSNIAQVKSLRGKVDQAEQCLSTVYQNSNPEALPIYVTQWVYLAEAYQQFALQKPEAALERAEALMKRLRQAGAQGYAAECLWLRGRALLAMEEIERAHQSLIEARSIATRTGCRRMLWRILADLGNIAELRGQIDEALTARAEAREIIAYITDRCGADEIRSSFSSMFEVRQILNLNPDPVKAYR